MCPPRPGSAQRLGEAPGDREAQAETAGRGVAEALERLEHPLALRPRGTPGPRSTTMTSTVSGRTWASTRTGLPPEWRTALLTRLATTRSRSPASVSTIGTDSSTSRATARASCPATARGSTSSSDRGRERGVHQPALQPGQVEQVVDEPLELAGRGAHRVEELVAVLVGDRAHEQPVDGGAHGGQGGAQVVRDRAQQRGGRGLGLLQGGRPHLALAQPAVLQHQAGLDREGFQHPLVGRAQRLAAQREHVLVVDPDPGVALVGRRGARRARTRR